MKILGFDLTAKRALPTVGVEKRAFQSLGGYSGVWRRILEPYTGAWQQNVEEKRGDLITYPTLYACLYRISSDIGKLPFMLTNTTPEGITRLAPEAQQSAYAVLKEPNNFQTQGQFREYWMLSKLVQGNTYVLKRRDNRGVVVDLYVLDPERVMPMVSDLGEVYYQLYIDPLNTIPKDYPAPNLIVPASEIIHDRCMCVHNPLIGIPPLAAAYWPALKNMKIMRSATEFFANNAQPGGILTAPAGMTEEDAKAVQNYWATNFTGNNAGRVAIVGADMKFTAFAQKSVDSQMVEQMRYSDEQICQPFGIPPFKVGIGTIPAGLGVDGMNQLYYADALQPHIEHMESLLDKGLKISRPLGVELDIEPLLRMDQSKRAEVAAKLVGAGIETPNEGRLRFNYGPLLGGDTVYLQQQDFPLDQVRLNKISQPLAAPAPTEDNPPSEETPTTTEEERAMVAEARAIVETNKAVAAMREEVPMFDPEKFGEAMGEAIRSAVAPLLKRIEELESKKVEVIKGEPGPAGLPGEAGAAGEKGADGLGLAGAMIDRDGALLITLTNGEVKSLGKVVGKDGMDGQNGVDGVGLDNFEMEYLPESHEVYMKAFCGSRTKELRYPAGGIRPAGYWREGVKAKAGEAWVQDGSLWIAVKDCSSKPATNDEAWIIAARKGRDGERGASGKVVSDAPVKLVN